MKRKLVMLTMGALLFVLSASFTAGQAIDVPYGTAPVFSGTLDYSQWTDAYMDTFRLGAKSGKYTAIDTFWIKYNNDTLYVIWVTPDYIPQEIDRHSLLFDINGDRTLTVQADDYRFMVSTTGSEQTEFCGFKDLWDELPSISGWNYGYSSATHLITQFAVSLSKLGITPGVPATIGMALMADSPTRLGRWPAGADTISPATWAILQSSANWVAPATAVIDVPCGTVPVFSGTFDVAQWADAHKDSFDLESKTKWSSTDTFLIKYNQDTLYFIWITPEYEGLEIINHSLIFDSNIDRGSDLLGDDFRLMVDTLVEFKEFSGNASLWEEEKVAGWDCQYAKNGYFVTQYAVPFSKINIIPGTDDSIGFALLVDGANKMGRWPAQMDSIRPVTWGVLTSSNKWETPTVSVIDVPYGSSPAFTGTFDTTQWTDAYMDTFRLETKTKYQAIDTFFVKYNNDSLYFIWVTPDYEPQEIAHHSLIFDSKLDRGTVLLGEDYKFTVDTVTDFQQFNGASGAWVEEKVNGWDCQSTNNISFVTQFAVAFSALDIIPGTDDSIGFALLADSDTRMGRWPALMDSIRPVTWGVLTSSNKWETPTTIIDVPFGTAPVFDGSLDSTQWMDAHQETFSFPGKSSKAPAADSFWVKHTADTLYVMVITPDFETIGIKDHSLLLDLKYDRDTVLMGYDYRLMGDFITASPYEFYGNTTIWEPTTLSSWVLGLSDKTDLITQFAVPLANLNIDIGEQDTIGFAVMAAGDVYGAWPYSCDSISPVTWGALTSSAGWTGVAGQPHDQPQPQAFSLSSVYPNPVQTSAEFRYQLAQASPVKLSVYNIAGQLVKSFDQRVQVPGSHAISWNVQSLPSGVYLYRLEAGNNRATRRMLVIK